MINENENEESFIFTKNHAVNIHLINRNIIAINSNEDIHNLEETPMLSKNVEVESFGLRFLTEDVEGVDLELDIQEDLAVKSDDEILTVKQGKVIARYKVQKDNYHYTRGAYGEYAQRTKNLPAKTKQTHWGDKRASAYDRDWELERKLAEDAGYVKKYGWGESNNMYG